MTNQPRSQELAGAFAYEHADIRARPGDLRMAAARRAAAPPPPAAATGVVQAIEKSGYRVIVTEHCTRGLAGSDGTTYISPPQTEEQARSLIALLAGATTGERGCGPWRQPVARGQRLTELKRQR
jgi:hypothetical protein